MVGAGVNGETVGAAVTGGVVGSDAGAKVGEALATLFVGDDEVVGSMVGNPVGALVGSGEGFLVGTTILVGTPVGTGTGGLATESQMKRKQV